MIRLEQEVPKEAKIIDLSQFDTSAIVTSSDGCCAKYTDGSSWVKLDRTGYEALAETIASRVARALGLYTVDYQLCFCKIDNLYYTGCVSQSFIRDNYEETTLGRLLCNELHCCNLTELMQQINRVQTPLERIQFVTSVLSKYMNEEELLRYLAEVLWFDSLIYNGDRHLYNILLFCDQLGNYRRAPLFDFGDGLLSNTSFKYPVQMTASYGVYKVKAKPFSTNFSKQVNCILPWLNIDYPRCISLNTTDFYSYYEEALVSRALAVLRLGLEKYNITLEANTTSFFT